MLSLTSLFVFPAGNQCHILKESIQINVMQQNFMSLKFTEEPSGMLQLSSIVFEKALENSLRHEQ